MTDATTHTTTDTTTDPTTATPDTTASADAPPTDAPSPEAPSNDASDASAKGPDLAERLAAAESAADELRAALADAERARRVDRELLIAGVVDLEGARAQVEARLTTGESVPEAVRRVRERSPLLFAGRGRGPNPAALPASDTPGEPLAEAAAEAMHTGDRRVLLRYLRLRRTAG